jgi:ATP adenylyltransferase/5',5'''-P-1,P-4-tetraphosphate phosphorylase II
MEKLQELAERLLATQPGVWELARVNYMQLSRVETRIISFGSHEVHIQFNPERIRSSAARVDAKSIGERPCFLCPANRPAEQQELVFDDEMTILVNPFPIFRQHLTIPSSAHRPQRILPDIGSLMRLAQALPGFVVFYNGPECGASAPDHFHFQAGNRGMMPVETDFSSGRHTTLVTSSPGLEVWTWNDYSRSLVSLRSDDNAALAEYFILFHQELSALQPERTEPMLNLLCYYEDDSWVMHIFPRKIHRPRQYFAADDERILLSPASVDLGGLIITPREEDFLKLDKECITDIFNQVCLSQAELESIIKKLK